MFLPLLFSLLSGALLTLSFAPFNFYTLAFILPAILLFIWLRSSAKKAFWCGWAFGIGFFSTGASWIYVSIYQFGNASVLLALLITGLFVIVLGLYPATLGYIFRKCFSRFSEAKNCLLIFPALWVVWEYLRSTLFTGFPWILLGYTQLHTPLKGFAPITGIYGLSLLTTLISGALVLLATKQKRLHKIMSLIIIFGCIAIGFGIENHAWTKPIGQSIKVSLIQGNIPQAKKWDVAYIKHNIRVYQDLTLQHFNSQLIVWPEGAFPLYAQQAKNFIRHLGLRAKKNHSNIIFGVPIINEKTNQYYNGLLLIGDNQGEYLKRHLVPFGEYIPLPAVFGKFMRYFHIPMSNFSAGPEKQAELTINQIRISPFICYEIAFPSVVLQSAKHSELLVTLSDDSWFGKSIALAQHLQMAQMRSLETGRPQLLSTNTGITAFISPLGKIMKTAAIDQRIVITDRIQPMTGNTPLMLWGNDVVLIIIISMLLLIFI
ncbi:MAG: apolipoprotein N-acyltransferase [Gammaproteobacteria bacterium CG_4_10_14_0_8_um_filter_38_16]|nr:MAG: apolipoprotein N-acyltransferase [Gammaproteobacteria bacterium CG_4_10_14_0_8_um_filter_38_16]PJA03441.1 MAG: apolipoprotein N-acyltransferase [Gammaproteobacteria bacterium CG_4_10_14_0_2_um_filter_38_22]PJB10596.1 MAG: apolipoprotein N-acyltransferase [Gammaproteobacteria bacterium CG_4_9_14_3_um_filter_38_9]